LYILFIQSYTESAPEENGEPKSPKEILDIPLSISAQERYSFVYIFLYFFISLLSFNRLLNFVQPTLKSRKVGQAAAKFDLINFSHETKSTKFYVEKDR
jgi:hypothetical protein